MLTEIDDESVVMDRWKLKIATNLEYSCRVFINMSLVLCDVMCLFCWYNFIFIQRCKCKVKIYARINLLVMNARCNETIIIATSSDLCVIHSASCAGSVFRMWYSQTEIINMPMQANGVVWCDVVTSVRLKVWIAMVFQQNAVILNKTKRFPTKTNITHELLM